MRWWRGLRLTVWSPALIIAAGSILISPFHGYLKNELGWSAESRSILLFFLLFTFLLIIWRLALRRERNLNLILSEYICLKCGASIPEKNDGGCPNCAKPDSDNISLICEECGERVALSAETRGTVQLCPRCGKPGEVPRFSRSE